MVIMPYMALNPSGPLTSARFLLKYLRFNISITYSKNIRHSIHLTFHLVEPSWILIALIELAPLEENMNPLVFGAQPSKAHDISILVDYIAIDLRIR